MGEEGQSRVTRDNVDSFTKCISFMSKLLEATKWLGDPVFIEGKNSPVGGLTASGSDAGESEIVISGDDPRITDGSAAAAAAMSPQRPNVPSWGESSGGEPASGDHLDMDVLRQLTLAQYKEKAGDVPFDENFVDDDWDMED